MRWVAFAWAGASAGCGFHGHAVPGEDARLAVDAATTGCPAPGLTWFTDFAVDPTTLDANGDGLPDFHFRNGPSGTFDGTWSEAGTAARALDTNPKQDFATRTRTHVRMKNTQRGVGHGAVFWINSGYTASSYAAEFLDVRLEADGQHQTLSVYWWNNLAEQQQYVLGGLTTGFVTADLDIDPVHDTLLLECEGTTTTLPLMRAPRLGDDRWATVMALGGDAVFDEVRIESCP